ncbi:hypothetical protein BC834DRAFT_169247 [Gloeopeniophorella convolvens]|nr:hypothetical protein BC834DRAFT_169247 [Gloeopeniophorella convolvens]
MAPPSATITPSTTAATQSSISAVPTSSEPAGKIIWQTALYLTVVLVVVALIVGAIFLVGRLEERKYKSSRSNASASGRRWTNHSRKTHCQDASAELTGVSPSTFTPVSGIVQMWLCRRSTALWQAFQQLRPCTHATPPRPTSQDTLPFVRAANDTVPPLLATPQRAVVRDDQPLRVPANPHSDTSSMQSSLYPTPPNIHSIISYQSSCSPMPPRRSKSKTPVV